MRITLPAAANPTQWAHSPPSNPTRKDKYSTASCPCATHPPKQCLPPPSPLDFVRRHASSYTRLPPHVENPRDAAADSAPARPMVLAPAPLQAAPTTDQPNQSPQRPARLPAQSIRDADARPPSYGQWCRLRLWRV